MGTYESYQDYKNSKNNWIGNVPTHWNIQRADFLIQTNRRQVSAEPLDGVELIHYSIPNVQEFGTGKLENGDQIDSAKLLISEQQLLVSKLNPRKSTLCIAVPDDQHTTIASSEFVPILAGQTHLRYSYYVWRSEKVTKLLSSMVQSVTRSHQRVNPSDILKIYWAWPSLHEQKAIARFLDHKTAQIDALIAKKQALLEKLAEQRTALISQAIIKGLDLSVPMKDSGVEWLREIPAHWQCRRLRFDLKMNPSKSEIQLDNQDLVSFVPMEAVGEYGGLNLDIEKELSEIGSGYTYFSDNDVVVAKITPCFENRKGAFATGLKNGVAFGTTELHVLRANYNLLPEYLFNITMSHAFAKLGESEMFGAGGQKRVPESFFKDFTIGIPPILEQQEILNYIQDVRCKFSQRFDKVAEMISLLHEYRAALITNAVTGKIDVRDFRLPTTTEQRELAHG